MYSLIWVLKDTNLLVWRDQKHLVKYWKKSQRLRIKKERLSATFYLFPV